MGQAATSCGMPVPPNAIVGQMPVIPTEDTTGWEYLYRIPLDAGRQYSLKCWKLGKFLITGGSCDYFTLEMERTRTSSIQILDDRQSQVAIFTFQQGDRVTFQDNPDGEGGSSAILTRGGKSAPRLPIPVRAEINNVIQLTGDRDFRIIGSGAHLFYSGFAVITVEGGLANLHLGVLHNIWHDSPTLGGTVIPDSEGTIFVEGSVEGMLTQEGCGTVEVKGDVKGLIQQTGCGSIFVRGKHGPGQQVIQTGNGTVQIDG